ncbi:MAG: type I 3-dehydroquinate dehydratase [Chitinispirillaceae bacterium]|nr:type I 3-dehydroquinate dehydratase [Chitinispirillaceae bacterium]
MISLGPLALGNKPLVAGVVDAIVPSADLLDLRKKGLAIIEIRADLIEKPLECIARYVADISAAVGLPMIGTVRENERTRERRLELFTAILPFVDCVDVELGATDAAPVTELARSQKKVVLVSEHDFETTPDTPGLQSIVDRAIAQGAQIVKVVTTARDEEDAWRLLEFAKTCATPIVAFAMGEAGIFSRLRACEYGSLFTYGYITKPVAPGQLSVGELLEGRPGVNQKSA